VKTVRHGWIPACKTTVVLCCGCRIKAYETPRPGTRLACKSNQGHGYRLSWVSAIDDRGVTVVNERA
jgi:hypothetical protein